MDLQHSIRKPVSCEGTGLHTGAPAAVRLRPAPPDHGLVFVAGPDRAAIPVRPESLLNGHYATTIGRAGGAQLQTVEHLLAAIRGLRIDNLLIEVDGPELPAMDGSAAPFVSLLYSAGRESQPAVRPAPLRITETIRVGDEARWIQIGPAPELTISYTLDVDHPAVGVQAAAFTPTERVFVKELAPARTYGFLRDLELMRQQGLALGGSLDNAVVLGQERVLNGALRFPDEFVRHKILDVVGDLALLGVPVAGHVVARNAGHALNHRLVREIARHLLDAERGAAGRLAAPAMSLVAAGVLDPRPGIAAL
jgi:UDP-3-O-[3-hydroxymyristoyl] N-acetylglucosamine deacetylase